jgi:6,7-dimethyl-8-ribityllumazine synthase
MQELVGELNAADFRFAVIVSRFNSLVTERLLEGALDGLRRHGVAEESIILVRVPGSWEMPVTARQLAVSGAFDAIICLGAIVRGDTPHFDHVANNASSGLARVALDSGIPVVFGVLTTDTLEQALDRAGGKSGNKGYDAAVTAIEMASLARKIQSIRSEASRANRPARQAQAR